MKKGVVGVDHPIVQKKIDRSLDLSIREGAAASIATNFSMSYFAAAALALSATAVQMGILYAVISLLPSIIQLKAAALIKRFSRKRIVLSGVIGKTLLVPPILLVGYLHWTGVPYMVWAFIGLVGLHYIGTSVSHPAWFSWMGSLVPEQKRGNYFSKRNRVVGFFGVLTMIAGALILDGVKSLDGNGDLLGFTLLGFGVLFVLSGMFRMWSWKLLKISYEPRLKIRKKDRFSLKEFLKHCKETPFGRFSLFAGVFSFAVGISSPYWAVYMLRDLGMSYIWFMAITVSSVTFQLIFLPLLGKFSDRFGNIKLMQTCSMIVGTVPLFWIASVLIDSSLMVNLYLLIVPSIVGGFAWAGYNLALNNYVYDAVGSRKQGFGVSYMNLLIGLGAFIGAGVGALLAFADIDFMGSSMLFIFAISGVGRLLVGFYGSRRLHEVRNVKKFSSQFWIREFAPAQEVIREIHNLENLAQKVEHFVVPGEEEEFKEEKKGKKKGKRKAVLAEHCRISSE